MDIGIPHILIKNDLITFFQLGGSKIPLMGSTFHICFKRGCRRSRMDQIRTQTSVVPLWAFAFISGNKDERNLILLCVLRTYHTACSILLATVGDS